MSIRSRLAAPCILMLVPMAGLAADINGAWKAGFATSIGKQDYTNVFAV
jgi:hypothetical protein